MSAADATPPASFVEKFARATGIFDPSSIIDPTREYVSDDLSDDLVWEVAAYGPGRNLIASTTANDAGELAEPLHVPAGGYLWLRSNLLRSTLPVPVANACTITWIKRPETMKGSHR